MVGNLMMSVEFATLVFLKIKVFWNKSYGVITSVYNVTKKNISNRSTYIVDMVMRPKFGSSSILLREVLKTSIL